MTSYRADMPLCDLLTAEVLLVTSLRLWNVGDADPDGTEPRWRAGFRYARVQIRGALAFDQFCRMLAVGALRSIQVRSLGCRCLSRDEAVVLQALGSLQSDLIVSAEATLLQLCPPTAARLALTPGRALVEALGARRMWLPRRSYMCLGDSPAAIAESRPVDSARLH